MSGVTWSAVSSLTVRRKHCVPFAAGRSVDESQSKSTVLDPDEVMILVVAVEPT